VHSPTGALYSIGYTVEEIEAIALETNWPDLFSDRIPRRDQAIEAKTLEDRYLIGLPMVGMSVRLPRGLFGRRSLPCDF